MVVRNSLNCVHLPTYGELVELNAIESSKLQTLSRSMPSRELMEIFLALSLLAWFILQMVTAGNGISFRGVEAEFIPIIIGFSVHFCHRLEMKYAERKETIAKEMRKKIRSEKLSDPSPMYFSPCIDEFRR